MERIMVTSIFSFFHHVFERLLSFLCSDKSSLNSCFVFYMGLFYNTFHTMPHFNALKMYSCRKHCEKRRNCLYQAISPFLTCFLPYMVLIFYFKCTLKYRPQFLAPLAVGQQAYVMVCCPLCVHPSVR